MKPEQIAAVAGVIKEAAEKEAKRSLKPTHSYPVDFTVRIRGSVQVGAVTIATSGEKPATVDLKSPGIVAELLSTLGAGPDKIRKALRSIAREGLTTDFAARPINAAILETFVQVENDIAKKLPPIPVNIAGRAAAVRTEATIELVEAKAAA